MEAEAKESCDSHQEGQLLSRPVINCSQDDEQVHHGFLAEAHSCAQPYHKPTKLQAVQMQLSIPVVEYGLHDMHAEPEGPEADLQDIVGR